MRGGHDQRAVANHVPGSTVDLELVLGEVRDLAVILLLASIAKEHNTLDHALDVVGELGDRAVHDSCSLTIGHISGASEETV